MKWKAHSDNTKINQIINKLRFQAGLDVPGNVCMCIGGDQDPMARYIHSIYQLQTLFGLCMCRSVCECVHTRECMQASPANQATLDQARNTGICEGMKTLII